MKVKLLIGLSTWISLMMFFSGCTTLSNIKLSKELEIINARGDYNTFQSVHPSKVLVYLANFDKDEDIVKRFKSSSWPFIQVSHDPALLDVFIDVLRKNGYAATSLIDYPGFIEQLPNDNSEMVIEFFRRLKEISKETACIIWIGEFELTAKRNNSYTGALEVELKKKVRINVDYEGKKWKCDFIVNTKDYKEHQNFIINQVISNIGQTFEKKSVSIDPPTRK